MSALYAGLTVFVLTAAGAMALYVAIYGSNRPFDERISDLGVKMRVTYGNPLGLDVESDTFARSLFRWVAKRLPEPPLSSKEGEKLAQTLVRAGFPGSRALRVFHFTRLAITAGLAFGLLALSLTLGYRGIKPLMFMLMGAGAGGFVPGYYLARRARKRQQEIANQLSDVLDLLVVCVEAGLGLNEAIKVVGSETQRQKQQIGSELAMVSAELGAGSSLGTALRAFADRTAVDDIKPLAATLVQSEKNWAPRLARRCVRYPTRCAPAGACAPRKPRQRPPSRFCSRWSSSSCPR